MHATDDGRTMTESEYEILAMRLILAYMTDNPDERAFYVWDVLDQSGCTSDQFEVAARTAREAASWWRESGTLDQGREHLLAKLDQLVGTA